MGTPEFAIPTLSSLLASRHDVVEVYTQPPKPVGRNYKITKTPVHQLAEHSGVQVRTPKSLRNEEEIAHLQSLDLDLVVVVAYGLILPKSVLEIPRYGCINVHASLLPRWRGAAPINRAIEAGDTSSGATLILMDEGLDTGPMLCSNAFEISEDMTATELHDRIAKQGGCMIVPTIESYVDGVIMPCRQPDVGVTYAHKLTKDEGRIDWLEEASLIARRVRAFNPWPGVWFEVNGERIKILDAEAVTDCGSAVLHDEPGKVYTDPLQIVCGKGSLRIKRLQKPGGKPMDDVSFLNGYQLPDKLTVQVK